MTSLVKKLFFLFQQLKIKQKLFLFLIPFLFFLSIGAFLFLSSHPKEAGRIQKEKIDQTFLKEEAPVGFALFDTNTWMKGEKELQMLEMRALKGELERDIATFDNVKKASVILDLVPQKLFGEMKDKSKASVILSLEEEAEITHSQLCAITYHLAGAVHGLEPNRITISDSRGKLYKAMHLEGEEILFRDPIMSIEEHLTEKITKVMNKIVGKGGFHFSLNILKEAPIALALLVEQKRGDRELKASIENQLRTLLRGVHGEPVITIDFITFEKAILPSPKSFMKWFYFVGVLVIVLLLSFLFYKKQGKEEKSIVDMSKLAEQIKEQEPKSIALICTYLDPERAEALLVALPYKIQKKVALHLKEFS